jgi:hypothetical protein
MKKQETVGFQLSAAVPLDRVGFILKAFFDNGCPPSSLDLKALIGTMPNGHGSRVHAIDAEPAPQIEGRKRVGHPPSVVGRMGAIRTAILAHLHEHKKVSRQELHAHLLKDNPSSSAKQSIDTAVLEFVKKGILRRPGVGVLAMTELGHKTFAPAEPKPAPSEPVPDEAPAPPDEPIGLKGNLLFAYSVLRAEPQRLFTIGDIENSFEASGRNPNSAKDTMIKLCQRKYIHRPEPGKYTLQGA